VGRALKSLDRCDVALLLIDSSEGITDQDAHVAGYAVERGRGLIIVFNKWDLIKDKKGELQRIKDRLDLKMSYFSFCPYLTASALTGLRVQQIYKEIDALFTQYAMRVNTGQVNRVLAQAVEAHTPPYVGRNRLKFYYGAQVSTRPPTFVVFANRPDKIHFSYERYLTNTFREAFGLSRTPVRLYVRSRRKEEK
jgi:GTP-binding protein